MIEAAERLFAERGVDSVSLRQIGAAAGQKNNSAAQYHFGTREALLQAIFVHRMTRINERRLAMLRALQEEGRGEDVRGLVAAAFVPLAETVGDREHPTYYVRFLSQVAFQAGFSVIGSATAEVVEGFALVLEALREVMHEFPAPVVVERMQLVNRLIVGALAELERAAAADEVDGTWREVLVPDLVDLGVALFMAPVSPTTRKRAAAIEDRRTAGRGRATGRGPGAGRRRSALESLGGPALTVVASRDAQAVGS